MCGVGLIGLFPSGRPERAYERVAIWTVVLAGFLIPPLEAASLSDISSDGGPSGFLRLLARVKQVLLYTGKS